MSSSAIKPSFAKRILRIVKILTISLLILIIAATALFYVRKDRIAENFLSFFNTVQNGEIKIEDLAFSPFKYFPNASIRLDNVEYYKSKSSNDQDPFAKIDHLYASIDVIKAINGEIYISEITLQGGFVFLQIDDDYNLNLIQALGISPSRDVSDSLVIKPASISKSVDNSPIALDLQNIHIKNVEFKLESNPADFEINLMIDELQSDIRYSQPKIEIQASLDFELVRLGINNRSYLGGKYFSLKTYFSYNEMNDQIQVKNGKLKYRDLQFDLDGTYDVYKDGWIDLVVDGSDNDMTLLALVIDEDILKINPDILNEGNLFFSGKIKGKTIRGYPNISVDFGAEKIQVQLPDGSGRINDFGFKGTFKSDTLPDLSNASLKINDLNASMSDSWINGDFFIENFVTPSVILNIDSKINLGLLDKVFKIQILDSLVGNLFIKSSINTTFDNENINGSDRSQNIDLKFVEVGFNYVEKEIRVRDLTGELSNIDSVTKLKDFTVLLNNNQINFEGTIINMVYGFLKNIEFEADLHITADTLNVGSVMVKESVNKNAFIGNAFTGFESNIIIHSINGFYDVSHYPVRLTINKLKVNHTNLPDIQQLSGSVKINEDSVGSEVLINNLRIKTSEGFAGIDAEISKFDSVYKIKATVTTENLKLNNVSNLLTGTELTVDGSFDNTLDASFSLSSEFTMSSLVEGNLNLKGTDITYIDTDIDTVSLDNLQLNLDDIIYHRVDSFSFSNFSSLSGEIKMNSIFTRYFDETNIHINVDKQDLLLDLSLNVNDRSYGTTDIATIHIDANAATPSYNFAYQMSNIQIDSLLKPYYEEDIMSGELLFRISITSSGSTMDSVARNATGNILLEGKDLIIYGIDLDEILKNYKKSQNFRLTDVGAFFVLGPFGPVITKGYDFAKISKISPEDSTIIRHLYSKWSLSDEVISSEDVAFTTDKSRIAFIGSVNLRDQTIPGLTVSVIDKRGCSLMDQTISGSFENPELGDLNVVGTLFGAVINVFKLAAGNQCKPVYTGSVTHPVK